MKVYLCVIDDQCGQLICPMDGNNEYTWLHFNGKVNDNSYPLETLQKTHCLEYEDLWMAINLLIELGIAKEVDDK